MSPSLTSSASTSDQKLDLVFQALSDTSRRRILQILRQAGELRVSDIAPTFNMSLNAVSKHLKVLERAGLIVREIRGREHWFSSQASSLIEAKQFFHLIEHFWKERLQNLAQQLEQTNHLSKKETDHD